MFGKFRYIEDGLKPSEVAFKCTYHTLISLTMREGFSPFIESLLWDTKLKPPKSHGWDNVYGWNIGSFYAIDPTLRITQCENTSGIWILEFDGEHSNSRSRARIVLITHSEEATFFSYRLEYDCKNNIVEYKSLLIGFNLALNRNIKFLKVTGDSNMVFSQVKLKFVAKNVRLRKYRDSVRDTI